MRRGKVTFSTDGLRDFVLLPDGVRYVLGTLSVAKLLEKLVTSSELRRVLDSFNEGKRPVVSLDLDALQEVMETSINRARWTASAQTPVIPLIPDGNRTPRTMEGTIMADMDSDKAIKDAVAQQVAHIEKQIALLTTHAKEASPGSISKDMMDDEIGKLRNLIKWLERPSPYGHPYKNDTGYVGPAKTAASFTAFEANNALAEDAIKTVEATKETIERLVAAGKKFNHAKAKADLYKIASRVSEIVASVDLGYEWVREDLATLAKQAHDINGLFPAKV